MTKNAKTWLVTGASKGLGLALVKTLLTEGYNVAATSRMVNTLTAELGDKSATFLPLEVDIIDEHSVQIAVNAVLDHFSGIDIVVNNAGFGQIGTLEELSDQEARKNFDANLFGTLNIIRAVMPYFREQRSGYFMNISSMAGFFGNVPGWGIYCSSKFAVSGLTEALAAEVKEFGIKATVIYPGHMRTNFLGKDSIISAKNPIADYVSVRKGEEAVREKMNGNQEGDPQKAAAVLIKMSKEEQPPVHLFLGNDCFKAANAEIDMIQKDLDRWKETSLSIGFDSQMP